MLVGALTTDAFYVGALGSRRNQERRRERLLKPAIDESALERINGASARHRRTFACRDGAIDSR
jgi:xanthine dehydrogenase accessory factor